MTSLKVNNSSAITSLNVDELEQTALFKLGQMQMRNPHCFYEITTSEEYLAGLTD